MNHQPSLRSRVLWSKFLSEMPLYIAAFIFSSLLTSLWLLAAAKHSRRRPLLVTSLKKVLLPQLLGLDSGPGVGRVQVVPNFFSSQLIEITELIGPLKAAEMCLYYSPDLSLRAILSRTSTENFFDFILSIGSLTCTVNSGTFQKKVACLHKSSPINWIYQR